MPFQTKCKLRHSVNCPLYKEYFFILFHSQSWVGLTTVELFSKLVPVNCTALFVAVVLICCLSTGHKNSPWNPSWDDWRVAWIHCEAGHSAHVALLGSLASWKNGQFRTHDQFLSQKHTFGLWDYTTHFLHTFVSQIYFVVYLFFIFPPTIRENLLVES